MSPMRPSPWAAHTLVVTKVGYKENDRAAQTTPLSQQVFLKPLCVSLCAKPKGAHVQDPHTLMSSQSREDEGQ